MTFWISIYFIIGAIVAFIAIIGTKSEQIEKFGRATDTNWKGVSILILIWPLALIAGIVESTAELIARKGS